MPLPTHLLFPRAVEVAQGLRETLLRGDLQPIRPPHAGRHCRIPVDEATDQGQHLHAVQVVGGVEAEGREDDERGSRLFKQ